MKILVVNTQAPYVYGGAEFHADNLVSALQKSGHEVDLVKIPFNWVPPRRILDQILAVRLLDVTESFGNPVDLVIGLKFPAYFVKHPNKVLWVLHQHRLAYEQWDPKAGGPDLVLNAQVRESIIRADNQFIPEARKIFANSKTVAERLKRFNGIDSTVLYHPPPGFESLCAGAYGDYVFYPSRMGAIKRQHLAIEAMQHVRNGVRLLLAGSPMTPVYESRLRDLVEKLGLQAKVEFLGHVSEDEKRRLYSNALAVVYVPRGEDYGYVTLEGFFSGKAVITCADSGGPLEFVRHDETGLVSEPESKALGDAIDSLVADREKARRLGQSAMDLVKGLDLSWEHVVASLVS